MTQQATFLTLKRAAQVLGVHEQTLRSWERRGLIRLRACPKAATGACRSRKSPGSRLPCSPAKSRQGCVLFRPG